MTSLAIGLALGLAQQTTSAPLPPYVKRADAIVLDRSFEPAYTIDSRVFFVANFGQCAAYDLPSTQRKWSITVPGKESADAVCADASGVYIVTSRDTRARASHLYCLSPLSGQVRWKLALGGNPTLLAKAGNWLYASLKPNTISKINATTKQALWTVKVGDPKDQIAALRVGSVQIRDGAVVVQYGQSVTCVAEDSGRRLWSDPGRFSTNFRPVLGPNFVWLITKDGSKALSLKGGQNLWATPGFWPGEFSGSASGTLVGFGSGELRGINPSIGHTVWSMSLGSTNEFGGEVDGACVGGLIFASGAESTVVVTSQGKTLTKGKARDGVLSPIWTDGVSIVTFDGKRLARYVHGAEAPLPTTVDARNELAREMVARFDRLDDAEKKRLVELKDNAFEPLLKLFMASYAAYDKIGLRGNGYPLYERGHDIGDLLMEVTSARRTSELMAALDMVQANAKASSKPLLLTLLGRYGNPDVVTPYFIREIDHVKTPGFEMYESNTFVARDYVVHSKDPRAVAFMLKALKDPKADEELRAQAYWHLAGTGGNAGLDVVLAERHHRTLLRPIEDRVLSGYLGAGEFGAKTAVDAEKTGPEGRHWGLLRSGALGNARDVWLAEKVDGKWVRPLFTGLTVAQQNSRRRPGIQVRPPSYSRTAEQLLAGDWVKEFVGNPKLTERSAGGLTGLERDRLGLIGTNPDSDGDGDPDGVDPWPNAAERPLTDAEKVLDASFEARYHFEDSEGPGIFLAVEGMIPFEMVGRRGTMIWSSSDRKVGAAVQLASQYENGVAFIRFAELGRDKSKPWEDQVINWNADHTEASVQISTYFGGLNGTGYDVNLKKFGDVWVVTEMRMAYVS